MFPLRARFRRSSLRPLAGLPTFRVKPHFAAISRRVCAAALALSLAAGAWAQSAHAALIFGPASPVVELNSAASDRMTWISPDGLTAVLQSNRLGTFDIFSATRTSLSDPFGAPITSPFTTVNNSTFNSGDAVLSSDGLELFYHSANSPSPLSFFRATRAGTAVNFAAGSQVTTVPTTSGDNFNRPTWLSADGNRLYYFNDSAEPKLATRTLPTVAFTPSAFDPFSLISLGGNAGTATLSPDELTIIFTSGRPGGLGLGDLWYSTRASLSDPFSAPLNLASINTAASESGPVWFGDTLYFTRIVGGNPEIFSASLTAVPEPASAVLVGVGAAFLFAGARRRARGAKSPAVGVPGRDR